jgi:pimeloyl-ACP methyl ester carboxylesterase
MALKTSDQLFSSDFSRWHEEEIARQDNLLTTKRTVTTSRGTMEYSLTGKGPVILGVHGAPGGFDQALFLFDWITQYGFSILCPSRPGYLRTPLSTGKTPAEQADAFAALLDSLNIDNVMIICASAGGAAGYEFAIRYPDRVRCLIAVDAVSSQYLLSTNIGPVLEKVLLSGPGIHILDIMTRHFPAEIMRDLIKHSSVLSPEQIDSQVKAAAKDPAQMQSFYRLVRSMADYAERKTGLENDLAQLTLLSDLPLEKITCPALVVHGTHDSDVLFYHGVYAYETIPNAEKFWVREGSHLLCAWIAPHPDEARERVVSFLQAHR